MQGNENSGMSNSGNFRRKRTFGIGGRFQSARPPTTGKTVDELSSRVVVIQVKTFVSKPGTVSAPKFGGLVVIVEVSGGGVYVESGGVDSGGGRDGTFGVGIELIGLCQASVTLYAIAVNSHRPRLAHSFLEAFHMTAVLAVLGSGKGLGLTRNPSIKAYNREPCD